MNVSVSRVMWRDDGPALLYAISTHLPPNSDVRLLDEGRRLIQGMKALYPMIIAINLTRNSCHMVESDRYVAREAGTVDELIRAGAATLHPDCRDEFVRRFSRQSQLDCVARGEREIRMEARQMGDGVQRKASDAGSAAEFRSRGFGSAVGADDSGRGERAMQFSDMLIFRMNVTHVSNVCEMAWRQEVTGPTLRLWTGK